MPPTQSLLRTVDCLQRLFALLLSLAIVEAFKKFVATDTKGIAHIHWELFPNLITVVFTVTPFFHGMHKHLDAAYAEPVKTAKSERALQWFFVLDFLLSWIGFALFFALQGFLADVKCFAQVFFCLMLVNTIWGFVLMFHERGRHSTHWAILNSSFALVAMFIAFPELSLGSPAHVSEQGKPPLVALLAFVRTVLDYWLFWDLYFPNEIPK